MDLICSRTVGKIKNEKKKKKKMERFSIKFESRYEKSLRK